MPMTRLTSELMTSRAHFSDCVRSGRVIVGHASTSELRCCGQKKENSSKAWLFSSIRAGTRSNTWYSPHTAPLTPHHSHRTRDHHPPTPHSRSLTHPLTPHHSHRTRDHHPPTHTALSIDHSLTHSPSHPPRSGTTTVRAIGTACRSSSGRPSSTTRPPSNCPPTTDKCAR